ncbi:hypothetical protein [Micromonospora sp. NPDC126480]|uniref:hypothetical protein n=1 Tax=Micromonospora sp. NPDC126480 TaxID=3155312 RepID=UPI00331D2914
MSIVENALAEWAKAAAPEQLDRGPTITDLGGLGVLLDEAPSLARGPHLPYLLRAVAQAPTQLSEAALKALTAAIEAGIRDPFAAWVLAEALDTLYQHPDLMSRYSKNTAAALARHAADALQGNRDPAYAHPAIAGLLQLSISGHANPHRVLLVLTEIDGTEPIEALERLPLLIGVAHDHYGEGQLITVLQTLEQHPGLPPAARNDARYELAVVALRAGLRSADRAEVTRLLRDAAMLMHRVDAAQEARLDARAYGLALDAVLLFAGLDSGPAPAIRDRIATNAHSLSAVVTQRAAWSCRMHQPRWLEARGNIEAAWARLVTTLTSAATHLHEPSWYHASTVLTGVLQVYEASRAVYSHPPEMGGLETLVSPPVEAAFIHELGLLHHLDQALEVDPDLAAHPDARRLADAISVRRAALGTGSPAEPPGKPAAEQPVLELLAAVEDPDLQQRLRKQVLDWERGYALTGSITLDRQLQRLHAELSRSSAWTPPASMHFTVLLTHILQFLYDRFDAQADVLGQVTAYLGPAPPGKPWKEKALQDDCLQYLKSRLPIGTVQRELVDVASGRTDITYTPEPGMRFVVEVKRHLTAWTPTSLEDKYIAQAANYTVTAAPFSILLVGDHSSHNSGYRDVEDSVWIRPFARTPTETPRLIIIGVLPIGRPTPSDLRVGSTQTLSR